MRFECFFVSMTAMRDDRKGHKFSHRDIFKAFRSIYPSSRFQTHICNEFLETKPLRNCGTFSDTWTLRHKYDRYLYSANILRPSKQGGRHRLIINYKSWFYIHWPSLLFLTTFSNMNLSVYWNSITFAFNIPTKETGYLSETFDIREKRAYATCWIEELLKFEWDIMLQMILGAIFGTLSKTAKIQKLDYLQYITINEVEVWCIDNGESICLMRKEEY